MPGSKEDVQGKCGYICVRKVWVGEEEKKEFHKKYMKIDVVDT